MTQLPNETAILTAWQSGEISTRDAAADLGLSYHEFLDLLAERGIPVVSGPIDTEAIDKALAQLKANKGISEPQP